MNQYFIYSKKADFKRIAERFSISPMLARIIRNRDITGDAEIEAYLNGGTDRLHDPFLLKGMEEAVPLLFAAIRDRRKIRIVGDYDTDGICSSHILESFLTFLGADCDVRLPDRVAEGYGLNVLMVQEAAQDGVSLILTCDNGVSSYEAANEARERGICLIVSDHHEVPLPLVCANVVIDAKQPGCPYPYKELCGAGVAYKIVCAMTERLPSALPEKSGPETDLLLKELLQYAGIATIADVVPLTGENRILAAEGLKELRKTENPGLLALCRERQLSPMALSSYHIGFLLAPCLNSAGRLENAQVALQLLSETSPRKAAEIAEHLSFLNEERKAMTQEQTELARAQAETLRAKDGTLPKVLVLYLPDSHESIAGIVAGRIKDLYSRPALVFTNSEEGLKGSGRSVDAYPLITELRRYEAMFAKLGGHAKAAGFTLAKDASLDALSRALNAGCALTEEELMEKKWIDMELPFRFVTEGFVEELRRLEPFGLQNERPVFAGRNVRVLEVHVFGKNGQVLKVMLEDAEGTRMEGICFGAEDVIAKRAEDIAGKRISFTFYPEINEFRNRRTLQLRIQTVLSVSC